MFMMASCSNAQSTEVGYCSSQNAPPTISSFAGCSQSSLEPQEDEDEDEDVDFNPFLKETLSPEASSSLSSESDGLDADVVDGQGNTSASGELQGSDVGDSHGDEETVMQSTVFPGRICLKELGYSVPAIIRRRKPVVVSEPLSGTFQEKDSGSSSGTDVVNDVEAGELRNTTHSRNSSMDFDGEGAICMRTRARYSLASCTLDELETFLQETDDEDDLHNVDDEQEYRKFLAAVLKGGDSDGQANQENEIVDDEDEDNDEDFQIEIEDALESDLDESTREAQKYEHKGVGQRPETRQNKRQIAYAKHRKQLLQQTKRPLLPILPMMPNVPIAPFRPFKGRSVMPETAPKGLSSSAKNGFVNGFTPHQVGQLYCLIHEHAQLLIQVFSLCVLDPSRQQIAYQVQGLISEMLHKRDQVLAWRSMQYPVICFRPPCVLPSVPNELPQNFPLSVQRGCSHSELPPSNGQTGSSQTNDGCVWVPSVSGPVLSILDVAPLNLVGRYMDDVKIAVREYQRCQVEATCGTCFEKKPLFPLPSFSSFTEARCEDIRVTIPQSANMVSSFSPSRQQPKKSLAASLVESSKKQSVALVPKEIVKLAQRFFLLFNSALFPHKPPPVAAANRVLFTDAEDELLAIGLMEYNTDWKAIRKRFLPCHSEHQIFVRQKNRCSSKAPENPIKAVRRMKTSSLTTEEQARIQEGLRLFKRDWMSIWKFIVPYRDPSLLPRQWRIAVGTQKIVKFDPAKKEERRLYESERRKRRAAALTSQQTVLEKESHQTESTGGQITGDDSIDNEDETYVHEAFLADWMPHAKSPGSSDLHRLDLGEKNLPSDVLFREGTSVSAQLNDSRAGEFHSNLGETNLPSNIPSQEGPHVQAQLNNSRSGESRSNLVETNIPSNIPSHEGPHVQEQLNTSRPGESQPQNNNMKELVSASIESHRLNTSLPTDVRPCISDTMKPNHPVPALTLKSSRYPFCLRPYRARRNKIAHLVKLAPDLPPVNLPSSVRVISQSAFKIYQCGMPSKASVAGGGVGGSGTENASRVSAAGGGIGASGIENAPKASAASGGVGGSGIENAPKALAAGGGVNGSGIENAPMVSAAGGDVGGSGIENAPKVSTAGGGVGGSGINNTPKLSAGAGAVGGSGIENGGSGIENAPPIISHVTKSGTSSSMQAIQNKNSQEHDFVKSRPEKSGVPKDTRVMEEAGTTESDLQMHPLLFRAPEDGRLPYYPLNCSSSTNSSFSFFSGIQPQINMNLFHNPPQTNSYISCSYKSPKETVLTSPGIDFHPLLQRTNDVNIDSTAHSYVDLASFRGTSAQLRTSLDAVQTESRINCVPKAPGHEPSSPREKANDLDLDIHLSSTSRKERAMGSTHVTENIPMRSTINAVDSRSIVGSKLVSDAPAWDVLSNLNNSRFNMDVVGDRFVPEIVMEEEELSDSDEDFGEPVEFECEEMADSEGEEGSDCEQIAAINNKAPEFSSNDGQGDGEDNTLSLKLGLSSEDKDIMCSSSWLSLDSCSRDCVPSTIPMVVEESRNDEGPAGKTWPSTRPHRSCKRTRNYAHELSLAVTPLKKPRKRVHKRNLDLNKGVNVESCGFDGNDTFG